MSQPTPRYDKSHSFWYCRHKGEKHYLGVDHEHVIGQQPPTWVWVKLDAKIRGVAVQVGTDTIVAACATWNALYGSEWTSYLLGSFVEYVGDQKPENITRDVLSQYVAWLVLRKLSPKTIRHKITYAMRVLRWLHDENVLPRLPRAPRTPPINLTPQDIPLEELRTIIAKIGTPRCRRLVEFIVETGCRPGEARGLRWDCVRWDRRACELAQHKTSRTGKTRVIPLTNAALDILESIPTQRTGFVFLSGLGKPYSRHGLRSILRRAGLGKVYALRHTRAQTILDSGADIADVAAWLGHSNLATVQRYAHVRAERTRALASRLTSPLHDVPSGGRPRKARKPAPPKPRPSRRQKSATSRARKAS